MCVHTYKFLNVFQYVCGGQRTTLGEPMLSFFQSIPEIKLRPSGLATSTSSSPSEPFFAVIFCCCSFVSLFKKKKDRLPLNEILCLHYQYNFILNVVIYLYLVYCRQVVVLWVFLN